MKMKPLMVRVTLVSVYSIGLIWSTPQAEAAIAEEVCDGNAGLWQTAGHADGSYEVWSADPCASTDGLQYNGCVTLELRDADGRELEQSALCGAEDNMLFGTGLNGSSTSITAVETFGWESRTLDGECLNDDIGTFGFYLIFCMTPIDLWWDQEEDGTITIGFDAEFDHVLYFPASMAQE